MKSKSQDDVKKTIIEPETAFRSGKGSEEVANMVFDIGKNSETYNLDNEHDENVSLGQNLRDIERDGIVSMEASRNTGLALMVGSGLYINEQSKDIGDAIRESLPDEISVEEYVPEEAAELPAEINSLLSKGADELKETENLPDLSDYSVEDTPVDLEFIDPSNYESEWEELLTEADPVIDEVVDKLNTNVTSWEEMGIDPSDNIIEQLDPETVTDAILYSFDNLAHLAITGTMSNFVAQAADRYTDKESLIAAAGMSTALIYAVAKEGFYEGPPGLQFDLENLDVQGDWMSNTIGAAIGTWSYLQNRSKEETLEGENNTGLTGSAARKMGRTYEKAKYLAQTNLPKTSYKNRSEESDRIDELDVGIVKYDVDELENKLE